MTGKVKRVKMHKLRCQLLWRSVKLLIKYGDFSRMAAVCRLGYVIRVFVPPAKDIWWSLSLCKIRLELIQYRPNYSFDNIQVLIFCNLGLKTHIHAQKLGDLIPKRGTILSEPQNALSCVETHHMTYISSKSVHWCGLYTSQRIK